VGRRGTRSGTGTGTVPRQRPTRSATSRPRPAPGTAGEPGIAAEPPPAAPRPSGTQPARRRVPPQFSAAPAAGRGSGKVADPAAAPPRGTRSAAARQAARPVQAPAAPRRTPPKPATASEPQAAAASAAGRPAQAPAAAGSRAAQRMPFLLLVCGLLGGAMASALGITVTLSSGSFQINELQQQDNQLERTSLQLQDQVAAARSPVVIEKLAYNLGMRPVGLIRYLNLNNGQIETGGGNGAASGNDVPGHAP